MTFDAILIVLAAAFYFGLLELVWFVDALPFDEEKPWTSGL